MDGEQACEQRTALVFAVDQPAFESSKTPAGRAQRFCVLHPLMTLDGERIDGDPAGFPNGGRVWWMLRDDLRADLVVPGAVWVGPIEEGSRWEPGGQPSSHRFQADWRAVHPAGPPLLEVLDVADDDPDPACVYRPRPLPWPRPTAAAVLLRGQKSVLGPLKADWDAGRQELRLAAPSAARPEVLRVPAGEFARLARTERFDIVLNRYYPRAEPQPLSVTLTRDSWLNLDRLREAGEVLDGSTDAQLLNWAAKHQSVPRAQADALKALVATLAREPGPVEDEATARKLCRLRELAADAGRVLALDEEVARGLAGTPAFADLMSRHAEALLAPRLEQAVRLRKQEIEDAVRHERARLDKFKAALAQLEADYGRKAAAQDEEFRKKNAARLQLLDDRERAVAARAERLAEQEKRIVGRLEQVIQRYAQEGDRIGDDVLAQLPILKKLGLAGRDQAEPPAEVAPAPPAEPAWLDAKAPAPNGPPLGEADFVEQFADVVEHHGFAFPREELVNLHVCVKTGGLTVLAGTSGTGKSSLPRLYAEALGWKDEYLHVPVRPDWLDDRDLVGAFNPLARRFEPANSGLVERLIAAALDRQRERGGLYLVCLDEMNLARVEHYFAQFLSRLELPPAERFLELFAPGLAPPADPYHPYQRLPLGENLRFLGTVNIDETTHFFSPKVLDRAQVVVFRAPPLSAARPAAKSGPAPGVRPVLLPTYLGWRRRGPREGPAYEFLLRLDEALRRSRLGLGFRRFDRMLDYLASARPFLSEDQALDFQLTQVVLPRLRPTAPAFPETFQALRELIPSGRFPRTAEYLARFDARAEDDFFQLL